jgi:hypothetical protein
MKKFIYAWIAFLLALQAGVLYVVWHFVSKYW